MALTKAQQFQIMCQNPEVSQVFNDERSTEGRFIIVTTKNVKIEALRLPGDVDPTKCRLRYGTKITTLPLNTRRPDTRSDFQTCQNEPIKLGTQIQPQEAAWVGTAGCPVAWLDQHNQRHWGFLSNWHVLAAGTYDIGWPQHQPTDDRPACAYLAGATPVDRDKPNNTDAAIADAMRDGLHTIDWEILEFGRLSTPPARANVGMNACKVGRTTGLTCAVCSAVDAAVRVGYGDFEAIFMEQDVFTDVSGQFSGPGDSGSTIIAVDTQQPVSLLFAGGGDTTIGNPMPIVAQKMGLQFYP